MKVEQFVMAYGVEQDRLRALLPNGFSSLRPVLRINAELRDGKTTRFLTGFLDIRFTGVGIEGGCPAEKDNAGCFFLSPVEKLRPSEPVTVKKGILRLHVPVALCPRRRARREYWQNAARVPVPAADRLPTRPVYRAERSPNPLPAGAGKLCRAV